MTHLSPSWVDFGSHHTEGGGLARTVGAQQTKHLPLVDGKGEVANSHLHLLRWRLDARLLGPTCLGEFLPDLPHVRNVILSNRKGEQIKLRIFGGTWKDKKSSNKKKHPFPWVPWTNISFHEQTNDYYYEGF